MASRCCCGGASTEGVTCEEVPGCVNTVQGIDPSILVTGDGTIANPYHYEVNCAKIPECLSLQAADESITVTGTGGTADPWMVAGQPAHGFVAADAPITVAGAGEELDPYVMGLDCRAAERCMLRGVAKYASLRVSLPTGVYAQIDVDTVSWDDYGGSVSGGIRIPANTRAHVIAVVEVPQVLGEVQVAAVLSYTTPGGGSGTWAWGCGQSSSLLTNVDAHVRLTRMLETGNEPQDLFVFGQADPGAPATTRVLLQAVLLRENQPTVVGGGSPEPDLKPSPV